MLLCFLFCNEYKISGSRNLQSSREDKVNQDVFCIKSHEKIEGILKQFSRGRPGEKDQISGDQKSIKIKNSEQSKNDRTGV